MQDENNAIVYESGVVEPISSEEPEDDMQMQAENVSVESGENVPTEAAAEAPHGQQTETVTESRSDDTVDTRSLLQTEFDALAAVFPGELPFTHLADMPRLGAFLTLREKGLTPREAYLAIEGARASETQAVAHLRAAAPRSAVPVAPTLLSRETLTEWRRLFPHLSDREIGELYRRTATN